MAILILLLAIVLRRNFRWRASDFAIGLAAVEVATLSVIAYFSCFVWLEVLEPFNLGWLAFMNLFLGLSWLLCFGFGCLWHRPALREAVREVEN